MTDRKITVITHPSLALIKYWGKQDLQENIAATSSLAVSLNALMTETTIQITKGQDRVELGGILQKSARFKRFFDVLREKFQIPYHFFASSRSNFPLAAGLASSSSGFAALALGACTLIDKNISLAEISACARIGSASSARAVFPGFVVLEKGALSAQPAFGKSHWEELMVIIAIIKHGQKAISSREAMNLAKKTSPYYASWLKQSDLIFEEGVEACRQKDFARLGALMRKSYLMMFSTMFTSEPSICYFEPESLAVIQECAALRLQGFLTWETMDAGPQVKVFCLKKDASFLFERLKRKFPKVQFLLSNLGEGPKIL